jgi:hypothetical protein
LPNIHCGVRQRPGWQDPRLLLYVNIHGHYNNDFHAGARVEVFCCLICTLQSVTYADLGLLNVTVSKAIETPLLSYSPNKLHFLQLKAFSVREKVQKPPRVCPVLRALVSPGNEVNRGSVKLSASIRSPFLPFIFSTPPSSSRFR